jgi:hypothetical protein
VKSSVTLSHFREFVSVLEGKEVEITDTNFTGLQRLCEEFGFSEFAAKLSEFRRSKGFQEAADADARGRIAALEERAERHNRDIAALRGEFKRLSTDFVRLAGKSPHCGLLPLRLPRLRLRSQLSPLRNRRPVRSPARFADHFGHSGDLRRIQKEAVFASVAGRPRWFQSKRISPPMRRPRKHSDCDFGHEREHLRRVYAGGVGIAGVEREGREREQLAEGG